MVKNEIIAIDLGGTNLRVGLVKNNRVMKYIKRKTPKSSSGILKEMYALIDGLMSKKVKGIGISCPGPLERGVIKNPPNIPFKNFDLENAIRNRFGLKTKVENDANCVAIAEEKLGVKKANFIILTIGTGIGGGIIVNHEIYEGQGLGGELGHVVLTENNDLEGLASGRRLRQVTKEKFGKWLTINDLINIDNKKSRAILKEMSGYLGRGIASLINIFDPEVVVLTGGVCETGDIFLNKIRKVAKRHIIIPRDVPIQWTKLDHPGILGASLLPKN